MYVRTYVCRCTCRVGVHIRGIYAEDQPPDPFRRRISVLPFLPLPFPFFSRFSFPPATHPPRDYPPISRSLVYSTGRLGTVLVTTFPGRSFGKRRIFSSALSLLFSLPLYFFSLSLPSLFFSRAHRVSPFYFACLCREKDSPG